jgi:FkbM family methyltransferase
MIFSNKINDITYVINNGNDVIENQLLYGYQWNNVIFEIIKKYIIEKNLKHFLNVGSHIGTICLPISLIIEKVTAIEAYPPTYEKLYKNIEVNNIKNINSFNIALGNNDEIVYFMSENKICDKYLMNRYINNTGGMHVFTEKDIAENIRSSNLTDKKIKGKMSKLDNLEIDNFDIILVDIEGCEYEFLLGAREKLIKNRPVIIIEIWDDNKRCQENMKTTRKFIIQYIEELGYKLIYNYEDDFIFETLSV